MTEPLNFQVGVNLGGWLSQYRRYDPNHFETFITEEDIRRIAGWGMDHVRLPVDYPVLEADDQPGVFKESGFGYIERCLETCRAHGLRVILDLHKAPGFAFDELEKASLFTSPALQERFLDLWKACAWRFKGVNWVAFELLNEIVLPDSAPWNALVKQAVNRIRQVDPERLIVVGGNHYNSADQLVNLEPLDDEHILHTFHFYHPMVVTHQKAYWMPNLAAFEPVVTYPGVYPNMPDFGVAYIGRRMDMDLLREYLQPAVDFMRQSGKPLYCGEFGVIDQAPMPTRLNWHRDFVALLREHGIGRAVWSYKEMDFGLVDKNEQVVNQAIVDIVSQK
jgi:endo-1,4-beta-mannosidase